MHKEICGRVFLTVTADGTSIIHGSDMWEWGTCPVFLLDPGTEIITNCVSRKQSRLGRQKR